jgi:hypothetical protein
MKMWDLVYSRERELRDIFDSVLAEILRTAETRTKEELIDMIKIFRRQNKRAKHLAH